MSAPEVSPGLHFFTPGGEMMEVSRKHEKKPGLWWCGFVGKKTSSKMLAFDTVTIAGSVIGAVPFMSLLEGIAPKNMGGIAIRTKIMKMPWFVPDPDCHAGADGIILMMKTDLEACLPGIAHTTPGMFGMRWLRRVAPVPVSRHRYRGDCFYIATTNA